MLSQKACPTSLPPVKVWLHGVNPIVKDLPDRKPSIDR